MPIESYRLEPYIYMAEYSGVLTVEEMMSGNLQRIAAEHDELDYVAIIDASQLERVPFDIKRLRNMDTDYTAHSVFIVRPPVLLSILVDAMRRLMRKNLLVVDSRQIALLRARQLRDELHADVDLDELG